jgi:hypothetical protein
MVARALLANNAITTLALAITGAGDVTMNVTSAAAFPALSGGNYFYATILDGSNIPEVVKVTGVAGTIFAIVRAADNTIARTFAVGAKVSMNLNAAVLNELLGKDLVGLSGIVDVAHGGHGATTAAGARTALGLEIGADVAAPLGFTPANDTLALHLAGTESVTGIKRTNETTDNDGSFDLNAAMDFKCTPSAGFTLTFTNIPATPLVQKGTIMLVNPSAYSVAAHANTKVGAATLAALSAAGTYELSYRTSNGIAYVTASGALA